MTLHYETEVWGFIAFGADQSKQLSIVGVQNPMML